LSTYWIENEHFRLVSMKMSVFKSKTGSLHTGTGKVVKRDPRVLKFKSTKTMYSE
jgi:hypothetical protein